MLLRGSKQIGKYLGVSSRTIENLKELGIFKPNPKFNRMLEYEHTELDVVWSEYRKVKFRLRRIKRERIRKRLDERRRSAIAKRERLIANGLGRTRRRHRKPKLYTTQLNNTNEIK